MPTPVSMKMAQDTDENVKDALNAQVSPDAEVTAYSSDGGIKTVTFADTPDQFVLDDIAYFFQANLDQVLVTV